MQSHSNLSLILPGEKERELWRCDAGGVWRHSEDRATGAGALYAIEAVALESVPFWAVEPSDGKLDAEKVVALKWESLGFEDEGDGQSWMHWDLGSSERRVLLGSAGLAADPVAVDWSKAMPAAFEISPRLFAIPSGEAAIWRELGRCVVAFNRGEDLLHFSVMSARVLNAAAAVEIRDLVMGLQVQGLLTKLTGVRVWTDAEPEFASAVKEMLGVHVVAEPKPSPCPSPTGCGIFPSAAARQRHERRRQRQRTQLVMALAALYVVFFAAWAGWLTWRKHQFEKVSAEVEASRPQVDEVMREQMRWKVFESATNPDLYPVEMFQRIASLLPPEGIRFKQFDIEPNKIVVSGEASTIGHAKKFQADVTNSPDLKQYTWNFPQPEILPDNRANFRAEGIASAGGTP